MNKFLTLFGAFAISASAAFGGEGAVGFDFRQSSELPALCALGSERSFRSFSNDVGLATVLGWQGEEKQVLYSRAGGKAGGIIEVPRDGSDALMQPSRKLTLALRVRPDEVVSTLNGFTRIAGTSGRTGYYTFHFQASGGDAESRPGTLRFYARGDEGEGGIVVARSSESLVVIQEEWLHLAMTFDEGTVHFYVNGELFGNPIAVTLQEIPALEGSHAYLSAATFPGAADDLLVIPNVALSGAEVQAIYEKGLGAVELKEVIR